MIVMRGDHFRDATALKGTIRTLRVGQVYSTYAMCHQVEPPADLHPPVPLRDLLDAAKFERVDAASAGPDA